MAALHALLSAMLAAGILLTVVSVIYLGWACPAQTEAYSQLFSVSPYTGMMSLKARCLLPWHSAPNFSGCWRLAPLAFAMARVGAAFTVIALFALSAGA